MISIIFWFTKNIFIKLTLGLFLRYPYNLGDFHPDILIEAILIKKSVLNFYKCSHREHSITIWNLIKRLFSSYLSPCNELWSIPQTPKKVKGVNLKQKRIRFHIPV